MPLQDLTPQLRTRLSRLERLVGLFVTLAVLLMLAGLTYYVIATAKRKGYFLTKAPYFTYLHSGAGLKPGDTVKLMGFDVGEITHITAEDPNTPYDVYIEFVIKAPFYGYVWTDSRIKVKSAGLLGARYLEVTKGGTSGTTGKLYATYKEKDGKLIEMLDRQSGTFSNYIAGAKGSKYFLEADEPPELSAQMDQMVQAAKDALPHFLALTNQFKLVLDNLALATTQLDQLFTNTRPLVANLADISANLRNPKGSLGEWLLPTNVSSQLSQTLTSANATLVSANAAARSANTTVTNTDARLTTLAVELDQTLENLSAITSNLNAQVQSNSNMLSGISVLVTDTDTFVQGLKRHWLLRSAFKSKTNAPPAGPGDGSRLPLPPKKKPF